MLKFVKGEEVRLVGPEDRHNIDYKNPGLMFPMTLHIGKTGVIDGTYTILGSDYKTYLIGGYWWHEKWIEKLNKEKKNSYFDKEVI